MLLSLDLVRYVLRLISGSTKWFACTKLISRYCGKCSLTILTFLSIFHMTRETLLKSASTFVFGIAGHLSLLMLTCTSVPLFSLHKKEDRPSLMNATACFLNV